MFTRDEVIKKFFAAPAQGKLPVAVVGERGLVVSATAINTIQGTFLARSSDRRARAIAAIIAADDLYSLIHS